MPAAPSKRTRALSSRVPAAKLLQAFPALFPCWRSSFLPPFPNCCWNCVVLSLLLLRGAERSDLFCQCVTQGPPSSRCRGSAQSHGNHFPFPNGSCRHIHQYFSLSCFALRPSKGRGHAFCGIIYGSHVRSSLLISATLLEVALEGCRDHDDAGASCLLGPRGGLEASSNATLGK